MNTFNFIRNKLRDKLLNHPQSGFKGILYHGTNRDFDHFDYNMIGKSTDAGHYSHGFYFGQKNYAKLYGTILYKCEITLSNPYKFIGGPLDFLRSLGLDLNAKPIDVTMLLKKNGFDGVITYYDKAMTDVKECIVFDINNIKILNKFGAGDET